jgi:hypothetical protein
MPKLVAGLRELQLSATPVSRLGLTCARKQTIKKGTRQWSVLLRIFFYYLQAWAHLPAQANNKERNAAMVSVVADFLLLSPGLGSPARASKQ